MSATDPSLATRAPESDLQDEPLDADKDTFRATLTSPISLEPQLEQTGLSEHCTTDRPLPDSLPQAPSGQITQYHDSVKTYISKPSDYPTTPARLLLFLTNGAGIDSINNQHHADMFARQNYVVVMPDLFAGDPAPNTKPSEHTNADEASASWLETFKLKAAETAKAFSLDMWLARHTSEKVLPIIQGVLGQAKEEFADAVSHGGGVYAVGYCFGGKYVLTLAGERPNSVMAGQEASDKAAEEGMVRQGPEIKAGICAHGTLVGREDLQNVRAPVSLICVEDDPLFPEDVLEEGRKWLVDNKIEHEIEIYKNVPHGKYSRYGKELLAD